MLNPTIDALVAFLESVLGYETGSSQYYTVLLVTLFAVCVATRLLVGIFGSERGIVLASLGVLLPVLIGSIAYALIEIYLVPKAQVEWGAEFGPWIGFGLFTFLAASILSRHFFDLNRLMSVFTVLLSIAVCAAGIICSGLIVDVLLTSSSKMEQREERVTDELERIHR